MKYSITFISFLLCTSIGFSQSLKTPTLSPFSKISQEIGLTQIKLEYSRPSAKGRVIFGELVPFNTVWRTGANASTKLTFNEAVYLGEKKLAAGTYALYTIPTEDVWTIIVHSNTKLRSLAGGAYDPANDVFRFKVQSQPLKDSVETFTLQFADLTTNSVQLQLTWENTLVNIPITVEVDQKIGQQIETLLKNPDNIPHRTYFQVAQYYLSNDKNLDKALSMIITALEKSENNFRYGLLKAKIEHTLGNNEAAISSIDLAHEWAKKANNANYVEQTALFKKWLQGEN